MKIGDVVYFEYLKDCWYKGLIVALNKFKNNWATIKVNKQYYHVHMDKLSK